MCNFVKAWHTLSLAMCYMMLALRLCIRMMANKRVGKKWKWKSKSNFIFEISFWILEILDISKTEKLEDLKKAIHQIKSYVYIPHPSTLIKVGSESKVAHL